MSWLSHRPSSRWSLVALTLLPAALLSASLTGSRSGAAAATPSPTPRAAAASATPSPTPGAAATASATPSPTASATASPNQGGGTVQLPGHTLAVLGQAQGLARTPAAAGQPITLTIVLARSDQAGFDAYLADVENPQSPNFRHFLSQQQLADRFGPTPQSVAAVRAFMEGQGFRLTQDSVNRLTLTFQGSRQQAEAAFAVTIGDFQLGGRSFFANTGDPAVPASLAPAIRGVAGLNTLARPH